MKPAKATQPNLGLKPYKLRPRLAVGWSSGAGSKMAGQAIVWPPVAPLVLQNIPTGASYYHLLYMVQGGYTATPIILPIA